MSMDMKASIPFLIFFWVWAGATVAQNTSADSLAAVVEQLPDDTAKVRRLYELGRAIGRENTRQGIPVLLQSHGLAQTLGAREWLPEIESRLAGLYSNAGALDTALLYVEAAARHYEELGDLKGLAKAYPINISCISTSGRANTKKLLNMASGRWKHTKRPMTARGSLPSSASSAACFTAWKNGKMP